MLTMDRRLYKQLTQFQTVVINKQKHAVAPKTAKTRAACTNNLLLLISNDIIDFVHLAFRHFI